MGRTNSEQRGDLEGEFNTFRALCCPGTRLLREEVLGRPALAAEKDAGRWNFYSLDRGKFHLLPAALQRLGSAVQPMELQNVASFLGLVRQGSDKLVK
jgi:phage terminase large subunit-like protein